MATRLTIRVRPAGAVPEGRRIVDESRRDAKLLGMNTRTEDSSAIWSALARAWPSLEWGAATMTHGAFHHVAVLGQSTVVRACSGMDHATRVRRDYYALEAFQSADLPFRFPATLSRPLIADAWSAVACSFVAGSARPTAAWERVRGPLALMLAGLGRIDTDRSGLPPARQWCGGNEWPALVVRITARTDRHVQDAANGVVDDVLQAESLCEPSVVHGDFGLHNVLWSQDGTPGLIDFDNAGVGDPAIDLAPLIGTFESARVRDIADSDMVDRARLHRASLPLQVAAAAELAGDPSLKEHALGNFVTRYRAGTLLTPT